MIGGGRDRRGHAWSSRGRLWPLGLQTLEKGDPAAARALFEQVTAVAERFDDPDLAALGHLGRGGSLIALGETAKGVALLDEAMVAVTAREVSPVIMGIVYCSA